MLLAAALGGHVWCLALELHIDWSTCLAAEPGLSKSKPRIFIFYHALFYCYYFMSSYNELPMLHRKTEESQPLGGARDAMSGLESTLLPSPVWTSVQHHLDWVLPGVDSSVHPASLSILSVGHLMAIDRWEVASGFLVLSSQHAKPPVAWSPFNLSL